MIKTIPKEEIIICDRCKQDSTQTHFKSKGHVTFDFNALNFYGEPAASGHFEVDLCDKCLTEVIDTIDKPMPKGNKRKNERNRIYKK